MRDPHTDIEFMKLALEQAKIALEKKLIPVGAVLVLDYRIISFGTKKGLLHTLLDHAEYNACYEALHHQNLWNTDGQKNLTGFTVYTTLEPCMMCLSILMTARVSRIVFGCKDPYGGGTILLRNPDVLPSRFLDGLPEVTGGVLEKEAKLLLRDFFEGLKKGGHKNWSDPNNPLVKYIMEG